MKKVLMLMIAILAITCLQSAIASEETEISQMFVIPDWLGMSEAEYNDATLSANGSWDIYLTLYSDERLMPALVRRCIVLPGTYALSLPRTTVQTVIGDERVNNSTHAIIIPEDSLSGFLATGHMDFPNVRRTSSTPLSDTEIASRKQKFDKFLAESKQFSIEGMHFFIRSPLATHGELVIKWSDSENRIVNGEEVRTFGAKPTDVASLTFQMPSNDG